jgi:uncharacterized membrane-anchored protein YhcB (DUF1043 family)
MPVAPIVWALGGFIVGFLLGALVIALMNMAGKTDDAATQADVDDLCKRLATCQAVSAEYHDKAEYYLALYKDSAKANANLVKKGHSHATSN